MNIKDQLINSLQPLLLVLFAVWGITFGNALLNPADHHERTGTVEIYALTPDLSASSAP